MSRPPALLDDLDRAILNRIQAEVPLVPRPFAALGRDFGISEDEMIARVQRLWDQGVIRRLGPIINYPAWEMSGVLVAAKLDEHNLDAAQSAVAAHPEITHAYLREHEWNLWFTVIAENEISRDSVIARVTEAAGLKDVRKLPKLKGYKLGVKFEA